MPLFAAGQKLTAAMLNPIVAVKTADETVNNSTVMQNDNELFVSVDANRIYMIDAVIYYESALAQDIKFGFTWPAGCTVSWQSTNLDVGSASNVGNLRAQASLAGASGAAIGHGGAAAGSVVATRIGGSIKTAGTAGTLQLQWAQFVAAANNTIVYAGSLLRLVRIA